MAHDISSDRYDKEKQRKEGGLSQRAVVKRSEWSSIAIQYSMLGPSKWNEYMWNKCGDPGQKEGNRLVARYFRTTPSLPSACDPPSEPPS